MTAVSDDIIKFFKDTGLVDEYTIQYGEWHDSGNPYYLVIIPDGGMSNMPWIRSVNYRILLIGPKAKRAYTNYGVGDTAEVLMQYMMDVRSSPLHQYIEPTEPSQPFRTESDRSMITFSLMTKLAGISRINLNNHEFNGELGDYNDSINEILN